MLIISQSETKAFDVCLMHYENNRLN